MRNSNKDDYDNPQIDQDDDDDNVDQPQPNQLPRAASNVSSQKRITENQQQRSSKSLIQQQQQQQQQSQPPSREKERRSISPSSSQNSRNNFNKTNREGSSQLQSRNTQREGSHYDLQRETNPQLIGEGRIGEYGEEEENIVCARFPHLSFCACEISCSISIKEIALVEVHPGIFVGNFVHGLGVKKMLLKGVTHVLNVTAREYKKRTKYFKYLNIDVYNKNDEDIKKHFRITNRFIKDCLSAGGKVLIHDIDGINIGPCFALAYLINQEKTPHKVGLEILGEKLQLGISPGFTKQLERYDLEKLALVNVIQKK